MEKLEQLQRAVQEFVTVREWNQFHSPKNLAMALNVETAEIVEIFQWLTEEQSYKLDVEKKEMLSQEIGDVMIYLINLSSKYEIDPIAAALDKLKLNAIKYPVEKAKGNSKKYNEF